MSRRAAGGRVTWLEDRAVAEFFRERRVEQPEGIIPDGETYEFTSNGTRCRVRAGEDTRGPYLVLSVCFRPPRIVRKPVLQVVKSNSLAERC